MLVITLFLAVLFLILGMGFLTQRVTQYRGSFRAAEAVQALACARAGLEDVRTKLNVDYNFPPPGADDQPVFSYCEVLTDLASNTPVGSYTVSIDTTYRQAPYSLLRITIVGQAGDPTEPVARRKLYAELDISPTLRDDPTTANLEFFNFIQVVDLGNL
jgi:hypothetical protein